MIILFCISSSESYSQNNIIFLVDQSGSMAGYYKEPSSMFKVFCKALIKNSLSREDNITVSLFSKADSKRNLTSPAVIFQGNTADLIIDNVISNFKISNPNDGGYGNTDLIEALDNSVSGMKSKTAVVWLITDNINDNSGSGDSSFFNTLQFYKRLRNDENIKKILLFPIPEKINHKGEISSGYIVYGLVYSLLDIKQTDLEKYDSYFRSVGIKQKPITLKPLDIGTLVLIPQVNQNKIRPGKLFYDGKVLRGYEFEEGEKVQETFTDLILKSNLFPYIIRSARLDVKLDKFVSSDYSVKSMGTQTITPSTVSNVSPEGEVKGFTVLFNMPEISPKFSLNTVLKEEFSVGGNLVLEVSNVDILLDENYMNSFKELFALQSIPEIFYPVLKDKKITTQIPLEIMIKYGPWRIFLLIGIIILIAAIITFIVFILLKKKCFALILDNDEGINICLNMFSGYSVNYNYSLELGKIKKSFTGNLVFTYSKFTTMPSRKIVLKEELPVVIEYEEDNRTKQVNLMIKYLSKKPEKTENEIDTLGFH